MTRRRQLSWLIGLSGFTAIAQYVIQGTVATTHNPLTFPSVFWVIEFILWGGRALIEAWILAYLFLTRTEGGRERRTLLFFEILLLGLITTTVGASLRALGYATDNEWTGNLYAMMLQSLGEPWYTVWTLGIGSYTAAMMAAAGTAYRIQPYDQPSSEEERIISDLRIDLEETRTAQEETRRKLEEALRILEEKETEMTGIRQTMDAAIMALDWLQGQKPTTIARLIALSVNGDRDRPAAAQLARLLGVDASTIAYGYSTKDRAFELAEGE